VGGGVQFLAGKHQRGTSVELHGSLLVIASHCDSAQRQRPDLPLLRAVLFSLCARSF